jgi:hypothetical protein
MATKLVERDHKQICMHLDRNNCVLDNRSKFITILNLNSVVNYICFIH